MSTLEPLVGRWATTIDMLHPPEAKGQRYRAVDTYRWLRGQSVLVHEVEARMGDHVVHSLEVYTACEDGVVSRSFDGGGAVADYRAHMADGVWRVEGATERFTSRSITADTIEGLWQQKSGDGWTDWMTVRLERVA